MKHKRLLVAAVVLAVGLVLWLFDPSAYTLWPKCPFRLMTGFNCPACGIQRFLHALSEGNVAQALHFNYWLAYALPYTFLLLLAWLWPSDQQRKRMERYLHSKVAVWTFIVSFVAWFAVRNIVGI